MQGVARCIFIDANSPEKTPSSTGFFLVNNENIEATNEVDKYYKSIHAATARIFSASRVNLKQLTKNLS
jgi:hypothetical protein